MARITKQIEHDWLAVRATFADGAKANVTWSRGGEKVTVDPFDSRSAETLSLIVVQSKAQTRNPDGLFRKSGRLRQ